MIDLNNPSPPKRVRSWMFMRISAIIDVTHETKTFLLVDATSGKRGLDFIPGQYITLLFDQIENGTPFMRSYTIASTPDDLEAVAITIKRVDHGVVSRYLFNAVKAGDVVKIRGPLGDFCYQAAHDKPHLVMVGGGCGVTPFLSIGSYYAHRLGQPGAPQRMTMLMSYRCESDIIGWHEFNALRSVPGITVHMTMTREDGTKKGFLFGRPDHQMFTRLFAGLYDEATFMTCGPTDLMASFKDFLTTQQVADEHIFTESFQ